MSATLYEVIKPFCVLWKYCGLISYTVEKHCEITIFKCFPLHQKITYIIHFIMFCCMSFLNFYFTIKSNFHSVLEVLTYASFTLLEIIALFLNSVVVKSKNVQMLEVLNALTDLDSKMLLCNVDRDYKALKTIIRCILIFWALILTSLIWFLSGTRASEFQSIWVICLSFAKAYAFYVNQFLSLKYTTMIFIAKYILRSLNSSIHTKLISNTETKITNNDFNDIKRILRLYEEFFECFESIKTQFSLAILFQLGSLFSFAILEIFNSTYIIRLLITGQNRNAILYELLKMSAVANIFYTIMLLMFTIPTELYLLEVMTWILIWSKFFFFK